MENLKKNIKCNVCEGIGMVKNINLYCINCDTHKCEFTMNITKDEFYKYKYCEFCISHNPLNSSPKTHCTKCLGEGYYKNEGVKCNNCKIPHSICNCIINPYSECPKCYGSGTIE